MALKYAKNKKMGKIVIFDENLEIVKNYKEYMEWKNIIKQALRDDKIIPYVQPIVDAKTKETKKYEVLLRLEHNGKIYPPFFLEHAKRAGLYVDLQKVMIKKSFEVFSKIDSNFSINLSVMELSNVSFKKYLLDMIDEYKVSEKLTIELLEDEKLMDEELLGFLIFLREMVGVEIAIDDFGSGNSNISYLIRKMPVTILKLDGSLIKDMMKNENNKKLIQVIVSMAKIFELKTIAEFVENAEIAECLEKYGVDCLQGYYFSKPFDINNLKEKE
ncbi:EAL domain-containing protein [Caminibacter pacificus]